MRGPEHVQAAPDPAGNRILIRYLLRWTSRPTPFGLFVGVAPVTLAEHTSVEWSGSRRTVTRPDANWLAELIRSLEAQPQVLRQLHVTANNLGFAQGRDWVVPCQHLTAESASDVVIRHTAAVRLVLQETQSPILFCDLVAKLQAESPQTPIAIVEDMVAELARQRVLISNLQAPTTVTDPATHLNLQLDGLDGVPEILRNGQPTAVDLRVDCEISLPRAVLREAERAASALVHLARPQPAWDAYHAAFLERYGPGALVAVRKLVDPDVGLGYPAGYRGSLAKVTTALLPRDAALAELAQRAALDSCTEVVLDDRMLNDLADHEGPPPPHTELRFSLNASTPAALDVGTFTLTVVSASRHAGTSVGRFLHLLEPSEQERFSLAYAALPTATPGALKVQLSCPPLSARNGNLTRTPKVLPVLSLGEYREGTEVSLQVDDLAVTADAHRFYLVSLSQGRPVEALMLNAVDLRHGAHPLSRILCEISTAKVAPCMPFFWGHLAQRFPFLPRIRYGRTVLSPARWTVIAEGLPGHTTTWHAWAEAFQDRKRAHRIPDIVQLGDDDVRIRLDLTEPAHLTLLRRHLDRHGSATLTEDPADHRWIGDRPHEIVIPLALKTTPSSPSHFLRSRTTSTELSHTPGASEWLYAKIYGHPDRQSDLLTTFIPDLLSAWKHGPADGWWFLRYDLPEPHLRLRLRLHDAHNYGAAARTIGEWADSVRGEGLLRDITLNTYHPETGRFGTGEQLRRAEAVFTADSALAIAQMATGRHPQALVAASYLDLATGLLGSGGLAWLIEHVDPGGRTPLDRDALHQARQGLPVSSSLIERRHSALTRYRERLNSGNVSTALADLLHLHHARMIGISTDSELACLRMARALVQADRARAEQASV